MSKKIDLREIQPVSKVDKVVTYMGWVWARRIMSGDRGWYNPKTGTIEHRQNEIAELVYDSEVLENKSDINDFLNKYIARLGSLKDKSGKNGEDFVKKITGIMYRYNLKIFERFNESIKRVDGRDSFQNFLITHMSSMSELVDSATRLTETFGGKSIGYVLGDTFEIDEDIADGIGNLGGLAFGLELFFLKIALDARVYGTTEYSAFKAKNSRAYLKGYDKYDAFKMYKITEVFTRLSDKIIFNDTKNDDEGFFWVSTKELIDTYFDEKNCINKVVKEAGGRDRLELFIEEATKGTKSPLIVAAEDAKSAKEVFRKGSVDPEIDRYSTFDAGNRVFDSFHNIELNEKEIKNSVEMIKSFKDGKGVQSINKRDCVSCPMGCCLNSRHIGAIDSKTMDKHQCLGKQCRLFLLNKWNDDAVQKSKLENIKVSEEVFDYFTRMYGALSGACRGVESNKKASKAVGDYYSEEMRKVVNGKVVNKKTIDLDIKSLIKENKINITLEEVQKIAKSTEKQKGITEIAYERYEELEHKKKEDKQSKK